MFKYGTNRADWLVGGDESDAFWGLGGDDAIYLGLGDDTANGGTGNDYIDGGVGDDFLRGGYGNDYIVGGFGQDNLNGNENEDVLIGGEGRDKLNGGHGDDYLNGHGILFGNNGHDYLTTGLVGDVDTIMIGGNGPDTFVATAVGDLNTTAVEVMDFGQGNFGDGDKFGISADLTPVGGGILTPQQVFWALDTNADHALDGRDPLGWLGNVWVNQVDSVPTDLIINVLDDVMTIHGVQALTDGQLYG